MTDDARFTDSVQVEGGADNITLLLEQAEKKGIDPSVVRTTSFGEVYAPEELAKAAKVKVIKDDSSEDEESKTSTRSRRGAAKDEE